MEFRPLRENELSIWSDHCAKVFGEQDGIDYGSYFIDKWHNDPWRDIDGILVAVENETICSTVRVFFRRIYLCGQEVSMGGIGEVCTRTEFKGRGLASELLRRAIALMQDRRIEVSMLQAGITGFYGRLGWQSTNLMMKTSTVSGNCSNTAFVRPAEIGRDLDAIKLIYSKYSGRFNGPVVRDSDFYWTRWINPGKDCWVLDNGNGSVAAYICIRDKGEMLLIAEFGTLGNETDTFKTLVNEVCRLKGGDRRTVRYPAVISAGMDYDKIESDHGNMYRLITPFLINGQTIDSTEQLIRLLNGDNETCGGTRYCYWQRDNF